MQCPQELMLIARHLEAAAGDIPEEPDQWSHISHYAAPGIALGLCLARLLVQFGGDDEFVRNTIRRMGAGHGYTFLQQVKSLHDLTSALDDPLRILNLGEQRAYVQFMERYLENLESELERAGERDGDLDEDDAAPELEGDWVELSLPSRDERTD